ncbi:MAG: glycoside hydrolase family 44 protein [Kineosporiaceae bacterium]
MRPTRRTVATLAACATLPLAATLLTAALPAQGAAASVTLTLDATAGRHPISPLIYGMNWADETLMTELGTPVDRFGGNATTRYNWKIDATNRASDWYFENLPEGTPDPSTLPNGSIADLFVAKDRRVGAKTIITVPLIGWTPKSRERTCAFSVAKYGPQTSTDQWMPDCGSGVAPDGTNITGNDPTDTSVRIGPDFVKQWVKHLKSVYKPAAKGGVAFYNLDNEVDLWQYTHRDVHPQAVTKDELVKQTIAIAKAVKSADAKAQTVGPVGWGFVSTEASSPLGPQYLQAMAAAEKTTGKRLLDYYDIHYYPQGTGTTDAQKLRSTRSLWDPTYTDESWINQKIAFIPRLKKLVADNYPGTKTAITEYSWGPFDTVTSGLAQADVLGIFGREGLDMANLWGSPAATDPTTFAFRMYRNYDGNGSRFGDVSVAASSSDQDTVAIYAAQRSNDRVVTVMLVNKSTSAQQVVVPTSVRRTLRTFTYAGASPSAIKVGTAAASSSGASLTLPASSITLVEVPGA